MVFNNEMIYEDRQSNVREVFYGKKTDDLRRADHLNS